MLRTLCMSVFGLFLLGCSSTQIDDYQNSTPEFKLEDYFDGKVLAWGIFQDFSGKVIRHFTVEINASWQGNVGTLDEDFVFDDGEKQKRIWIIKKIGEGAYQGTAGDVKGTANIYQAGQAVNLEYELEVMIDGEPMVFTIDDWMYRIDKMRVFNKSKMKKFGITVGEITLYFEKR